MRLLWLRAGERVSERIGDQLRMAVPESYEARCFSDSGIVRSENSVPHLVIAEKRRSQWERLWLVKMFWILVLQDQLSACDPYSTFAGRQTLANLPFGCGLELHSKFGIAH